MRCHGAEINSSRSLFAFKVGGTLNTDGTVRNSSLVLLAITGQE
jgi:hypothetical protein